MKIYDIRQNVEPYEKDYCFVSFYDYYNNGEKKPKKGTRPYADFTIHYYEDGITYSLDEGFCEKFGVDQNWDGTLKDMG